MELVFIGLVIAGIVWLVMRGRRRDAEANEAMLSRAWRIVLDDPNYKKRRAMEERSRTLGDGD
jgi:hypothetical protein